MASRHILISALAVLPCFLLQVRGGWADAAWADAAGGHVAATPNAAQHDRSMTAVAQTDECGKSGYGVASCPSFGGRREGGAAETPPPSREPVDECQKPGYGVAMCPSYGSKSDGKPSPKLPAADAPPNVPPNAPPNVPEGCGKGGYGAGACR